MIAAVEQVAATQSVMDACAALGVPRCSVYRDRAQSATAIRAGCVASKPRTLPPSALSVAEKAEVRSVLNSERYENQAPREVYADLLDQGTYLCSWRTMYRILCEHGEVRERRNQLRHPVYQRPELLASTPNQLWSWDITKLRGPAKWSYYYLYVMMDVFSRYVVGWLVAERESAALAQELTAESCAKQTIASGQLTIHADNGAAMQARSMAHLMADLGVNKTHSRPHVSNDNPFSEAQFKTLKYCPVYPDRFGSLADARQWCQTFFTWYNHEHHHTGIGLFTPADVHCGRAAQLHHQRQLVMQQAYAAHPARFVKGAPVVPALPGAVWINPPHQQQAKVEIARTVADAAEVHGSTLACYTVDA